MAYTFLQTLSSPGKNIYGTNLSNYMFYVDVYIEQSDAVNNYTNVKLIAHIDYLTGSTTTSSTFYFKQDNVNYYYTYYKLGVSDSTLALYAPEKIVKHYHNQDGTKTININMSLETEYTEGANANLNNYVLKSASINQNITLPTINRISPFNFSSFTMGSAGTITISPYVSSFRHKITYAFGSASGEIGSNISTSCSWTPSRDLGRQIPNSLSGNGTITVATYNGSTLIGSTSKTFQLWVAGDMNPTFESSWSANQPFGDILITKYSSINLNINNATGSYGSTIKSYSLQGEGISSSSSSGTTAKFNSSGTKSYVLKITDSRGRTCSKTVTVTVYWYESPKLELVEISRANENKDPDNVGNYLYLQLNYEISNPNNLKVNNKTYTFEYKATNTSTWSTLSSGNLSFYDVNGYEPSTSQVFELAKSYDIKFTISDSLESQTITTVLPAATCLLDIESGGVGVGKYWERGSLDVAGDIYLNDKKLYESGTFEASFYNGDGCSMIYLTRNCTYLRIGEYCICNIHLQVENFSSSGNYLEIIDLPFINRGGYVAVTIGHCYGIKLGGSGTLRACILPNTWEIGFRIQGDDGNMSNVTSTHCRSDLDIQVSVTYKIE